jgi:hypothetical protein
MNATCSPRFNATIYESESRFFYTRKTVDNHRKETLAGRTKFGVWLSLVEALLDRWQRAFAGVLPAAVTRSPVSAYGLPP